MEHHRLLTAFNKHRKLFELQRHNIEMLQDSTKKEGPSPCGGEDEEEYLSLDEENDKTD